jgi:rhodanese-related sulfurtransferase
VTNSFDRREVEYELRRVPRLTLMKMMDCSTLGTLVVNHEPIELIDVRSKNEFAAMHIPGARSIPFGELEEPGLFRKRRLTTERVYVISGDGYARASLATEMLRSAGCVNAVPVHGGMKDWVARGLPLRGKRFSFSAQSYLIRGAALSALATCVAATLHNVTVSALFLAIAGLMLVKAKFFRVHEGSKTPGSNLRMLSSVTTRVATAVS